MNFSLKGFFVFAITFFVFNPISIHAQTLLMEDTFHQTDFSQPSNLPPVFSQNNLKTVDKTEVEIQNLASGVWLNYRIRFQNITNGAIANIRIKDSLSAHLDFNTFQFTGSSHSGQFTLYTSGNLYIYYTAINLPDSATDYAASQGSFRFKIKLKENLPVGTIVLNRADIIFDFNPAITTNSVQTNIVTYMSVSNSIANSHFLLYPNPTSDILNIAWTKEKVNEIRILDITGKSLKIYQVLSGAFDTRLDVSEITAGMYFVHLISDESFNSLKLTKR